MNIFDAKNKLSHYISIAERGREVIITRHGKPVAKLVPIDPQERPFGAMRGRVVMHDDFDAPLPQEIRAAFEA